ncbi:AraC family transcriptional regulator, partial [Escherichia coli]
MSTKENINNNPQNYIVKNYYVANSTLVNVTQGNVVIFNMDNLCCYAISEGVYFLKKGIKVGLSSIKSKEKPTFSIIPIPAYILKNFCIGFNDIKTEINETIKNEKTDEWVIKAVKITHGEEVIKKLENISQDKLDSLHSADIIYSFYYILSHFINMGTLPSVIKNSSEGTLKERVYNIISNNLNKPWTLDNMAKHLCLSSSSLKRKLQYEYATFSDICLSARMNAAAKLLRKREFSVQKISHL